MIFRPHAYQQHCINQILRIKKLGLFLDMGLGKTVTTLTAIRELKYNRFAVRRVLVIAPKKVAEGTWTREKDKWDHTRILRVSPVLGSQAKRIRALNTPADLYIINRENVCWLVDYYRNSWPFDMVVVDESSSFKSHSAKRFKALAAAQRHLAALAAAGHIDSATYAVMRDAAADVFWPQARTAAVPDAAIRKKCLKYLRQLRPLYAHGTEVNTRRDWRMFQTMMRLCGPRFTLWAAARRKKG